jgi:uncharacterized membrane protein
MDGAEVVFIVILFAIWTWLLAKVTADIVASHEDRVSGTAWILIVWAMPLVGLIIWAYFRGRRCEPQRRPEES